MLMASSTDEAVLLPGACGNSSDDIDSTNNSQKEGKGDEFSKKTWKEDLVLSVQGRQLYVNSAILALASPVFSSRFDESFKEDGPKTLELQEKYEDFTEFLRCIYPGIMKPITRENVFIVAPLAHKYRADSVMNACEEFLNRFVSCKLSNEALCSVVECASSCQIDALKQKLVDEITRRDDDTLDTAIHQLQLSSNFRKIIADAKATALKDAQLILNQHLNERNARCFELENIITKLWSNELGITHSETAELGMIYLESVPDYGITIQKSISLRNIRWTVDAKIEAYVDYRTCKRLVIGVHAAGDKSWGKWTCKAKASVSITSGGKWVRQEMMDPIQSAVRKEKHFNRIEAYINKLKATVCIIVGDVLV